MCLHLGPKAIPCLLSILISLLEELYLEEFLDFLEELLIVLFLMPTSDHFEEVQHTVHGETHTDAQ